MCIRDRSLTRVQLRLEVSSGIVSKYLMGVIVPQPLPVKTFHPFLMIYFLPKEMSMHNKDITRTCLENKYIFIVDV